LLAPQPNTELEDHNWLLYGTIFNIFAATLHVCRPFLHPHQEDMACRGDKNRHTTETVNKKIYIICP